MIARVEFKDSPSSSIRKKSSKGFMGFAKSIQSLMHFPCKFPPLLWGVLFPYLLFVHTFLPLFSQSFSHRKRKACEIRTEETRERKEGEQRTILICRNTLLSSAEKRRIWVPRNCGVNRKKSWQFLLKANLCFVCGLWWISVPTTWPWWPPKKALWSSDNKHQCLFVPCLNGFFFSRVFFNLTVLGRWFMKVRVSYQYRKIGQNSGVLC